MKIIKTDNIEKFKLLSKNEILKNIIPELLGEIAFRSKVIEHNKEDDIFAVYEDKTEISGIYMLLDGEAALINNNQIVKELKTYDIYGYDEILAGFEIFKNSIRVFSNKTRFLIIPKKLFNDILIEDITLCYNLSKKNAFDNISFAKELAIEKEKSSNIERVVNRFNDISKELLITLGRPEFELKFKLNRLNEKNISKYINIKTVKKLDVIQAYTRVEENFEERVRKYGDQYLKTIKQGKGKERKESECEISKSEFETAIAYIHQKPIKKTRYVLEDNRYREIVFDFYKTLNLVVCEVEFLTKGDMNNFKIEDIGSWIMKFEPKDVTEDKAYKNKNLFIKGMPKN